MKRDYLSSGSAAFGLIYLPISCNEHMNTALLDSGASYFIALPQLKQFAPNSKDCWWATPLQIKLSDKFSVISLQIAIFFYKICTCHHSSSC